MTRRSRHLPLLLTLGVSASACADAAPPPPPPPPGAVTASEVAAASNPTPMTSVTAPPPVSGNASPTEPSASATSAPTPLATQPATPNPAGSPASATFQAEDQELSGQYVESITTPFSGVALYADGDSFSFDYEFSVAPGSYRADITGASSNSFSATGELRLDTRALGQFAFQGTTTSVESIDFSVQTDGTRTLTVTATNDNDTWDLLIDKIEISYEQDEASPSATAGAGF